ncbi:GNAT family N-acetyltransferase [Thalassospiraceae bacterium LMO-JJ14]|nr:GNAT family N-acetyltransferase [Thalassospiraceae bacterium LMO-JJ14]
MKANIAIRQAREDVGEVLTGLSMRSKQSNGYDDAFMAACRDELTVNAESLRESEFWVADDDGVCGCASLTVEPDGRTGVVHSFCVEPDLRGSGIGKLLWGKLHERAEALALESLHLDADPNAEPFTEAWVSLKSAKPPPAQFPGGLFRI